MDPEAPTGPAGALGVVEHEVLGLDLAIDEVVRLAAQPTVETLRLSLARSFNDLDLEQPIADQQRSGDCRFNRFFVLVADYQAVHYRIHMLDLRFIKLDLSRYVHGLAIDNQQPAAFFAHVGQDEVQLLAVLLEYRRPQLDLDALGQRQDGLEDLAGRPAGRGLAAARA